MQNNANHEKFELFSQQIKKQQINEIYKMHKVDDIPICNQISINSIKSREVVHGICSPFSGDKEREECCPQYHQEEQRERYKMEKKRKTGNIRSDGLINSNWVTQYKVDDAKKSRNNSSNINMTMRQMQRWPTRKKKVDQQFGSVL